MSNQKPAKTADTRRIVRGRQEPVKCLCGGPRGAFGPFPASFSSVEGDHYMKFHVNLNRSNNKPAEDTILIMRVSVWPIGRAGS